MNISQASASSMLSLASGHTSTLEGQTSVRFTFNTAEAVFERSGHDLVIIVGEERTVIHNFFVQEKGKSLPQFLLADGTTVAGEDFLLAQDAGFDMTTAAGPEAAISSGLNYYNDATASLLNGVERLGALQSEVFVTKEAAKEEWLAAIDQMTMDTEVSSGSPAQLITDNDHIVVNAHGRTLEGIFIHGDSVTQAHYEALQEAAYYYDGRQVIKCNEGNQTLQDDGSTLAIIGGNAHTSPEQNIWGNDTIEVNAKEVQGVEIYGGMGDDSISINADVSSAAISGDDLSLDSGKGGNDTISITQVKSGFVGGDAVECIRAEKNSTVEGGDDKISVTYMVNGRVSGDAGWGMQTIDGGTVKGGDDSITIANLRGGVVCGDAGKEMWTENGGTVLGGNDSITVIDMKGGHVSGDAGEDMMEGTRGGDDVIWVKNFQGGFIFGDAKSMFDNSVAGNDTIIIGNLEGKNAKAIYGDAESMEAGAESGKNVFIYDHDNGHTITLDSDGNIRIFDAHGEITAATNTTISGFSGIGGGKGDDILMGGSGNDLFIASSGNDEITGGAGADTFQWGKGFAYGNGVTTIKDFTVGEDKLRVEDLLEEKGTTQLGATFENNTLTLSMNGDDFAKISLHGSVTIGGTAYENSDAFYQAYHTSSASDQEVMLKALIESMVMQ